MSNLFLYIWTVLFQTIQFSISAVCFSLHSVNVKTVIFQAIQFSISTQFISIWPIDRKLFHATTPGQRGPWTDSNKELLRIPQRSSITGNSPLDRLIPYPGESYLSAEMQSVYSAAPADWVRIPQEVVWIYLFYFLFRYV